MINTAVEKYLLQRAKEIELIRPEKNLPFFGDIPVPKVEANNDFDSILEIVEKVLIIIGSILPEEASALLNNAIKSFPAPRINHRSVFMLDQQNATSQKNRISPNEMLSRGLTEQGNWMEKDDEEKEVVSNLDYQQEIAMSIDLDEFLNLNELRNDYLNIIADNWDKFKPMIDHLMNRGTEHRSDPRLLSAMIAIDGLNLESLYELAGCIYDEHLKGAGERLGDEIYSLAHFCVSLSDEFYGFFDLLGVSHYNRYEFARAIANWEKAKANIALLSYLADYEKDRMAKSIDSLIEGATIKLRMDYACDIVVEKPDVSIKLIKGLKDFFADWWAYWYFLGLAYMADGKNDLASDAFRKTLELHSGCHEALECLSDIGRMEKDFESAYENIKKALNIFPMNPRALGKLIMIASALGELNKVKHLLKKALELDSEDDYVKKAKAIVEKSEKKK